MRDARYMALALELARKGAGWTAPNPMVGAVIVKDGEIIGQGYHARCGDLHAERAALESCAVSPAGATLYVTLEPCCHYGRQPPCTQAILEAGIRRVVVGSDDPNPLVAGKGLAQLQAAGVAVERGVLRAECDQLNQVFFHYIRTGRPYVVLKYAMTMDGKIAAHTGDSRWITGPAARQRVHADRSRYSAIMVGVGTVLADDPMLNCRLAGGRDPVRVVCDSGLRTPLDSRLVRTAGQIPTILAVCRAEEARRQPYLEAGCQILTLPERDGAVDLTALMEALGRRQLDSVLLEGGGRLNWSALSQGIVQLVQAYIAPKLVGGAGAPTPVGGAGVDRLADAVRLKNSRVIRLGQDFLIESEVDQNVYRDR